jgi:hypothetical protein
MESNIYLQVLYVLHTPTIIAAKNLDFKHSNELVVFSTEHRISFFYIYRNAKKEAEGSSSLSFLYQTFNYSVIVATTPAPTVRPPSRIENLVPSSIAIGAISSTVISMLSPGITISTPSGRLQIPVMSEVRK